MERTKFSSRMSFILTSAGCAIGLGNVWRFPAIVGQYGGGIFILVYIIFLVLFGLPVMTMEFSVGRAGKRSIATAYNSLVPDRKVWSIFSGASVIGNYIILGFYTTVTGWMFAYFLKMLRGEFLNLSSDAVASVFSTVSSDSVYTGFFMLLSVLLGFLVCLAGFEKGVEKISRIMMLVLLFMITLLAVRVLFLDGARKGLEFYLVPDMNALKEQGFGNIIFAAMGQAFFSLSIGMGSMTVFGSYISSQRRLFGESIIIAVLDTFVALVAGLVVIPSCFTFGIAPDSGTELIFTTLPNIFNKMNGGRVWGSLFFLFMIFAAMSTVIGIFENLIAFGVEKGFSRKKSAIVNFIIVILISLPCALGFNLFKASTGFTVMDIEDFIVSNNLLPVGALGFVFFCTSNRYGWGWKNFIHEANLGKGIIFFEKSYLFCKYVLPVVIITVWLQGYLFKN